ncbi:GNAT family N-acetyltransferase [Nonomuraea turkmeniaca]|uniref:GNAT family N-acetyltransferase n=1 Tax=Nonomuraea turkmeniaca TaxID=103838 RepID=A0A5S4F2I3_9ACTN|nr:GNAT family N-acetyltransferase [Nonomuraea turkmeniaca]TMR10318.1 GNAT family N-acetyltransferase [Nonomuraea turkmeniaca]
MSLEPFAPRRAAEGDLLAWCTVFGEGQGEVSGDRILAAALAERLLAEEGSSVLRWAARGGDRGSIMGVAELRPQPHDPRIGFLRLFVPRADRRKGVASALLARIAEDARLAGMDRIQGIVPGGGPGEAFVFGRGGVRELLRLHLQEQRIDERVLRRCGELAACPDPAAYTLAHWRGSAPEPQAASFGDVMGHVSDAPGAAWQMAPRAWDRAAVRAWEAQMTAGGEKLMVCAAVHRATGQVVAATVTIVPAGDGSAARQHDTAVLPQHRGRGLARWIKAEQTLRLRAAFSGVRAVTTTVNRQNLAMVAVNRAVGYRTVGERLLVEAPLAAGAEG